MLLSQVMALTAMEKPVTLNSEDMRCADPVVSPDLAISSTVNIRPKAPWAGHRAVREPAPRRRVDPELSMNYHRIWPRSCRSPQPGPSTHRYTCRSHPTQSPSELRLCCGGRDEKVKVLRACRAVARDEVVLGQYTAGAGMEGYLEDKVPPPRRAFSASPVGFNVSRAGQASARALAPVQAQYVNMLE
jgi:hypothetical protein